jgi:hypothetical protein
MNAIPEIHHILVPHDFSGPAAHALIVMGTEGRHGVARALLGSVAERVVRTASVRVLTVHAPAPEVLAP